MTTLLLRFGSLCDVQILIYQDPWYGSHRRSGNWFNLTICNDQWIRFSQSCLFVYRGGYFAFTTIFFSPLSTLILKVGAGRSWSRFGGRMTFPGKTSELMSGRRKLSRRYGSYLFFPTVDVFLAFHSPLYFVSSPLSFLKKQVSVCMRLWAKQ